MGAAAGRTQPLLGDELPPGQWAELPPRLQGLDRRRPAPSAALGCIGAAASLALLVRRSRGACPRPPGLLLVWLALSLAAAGAVRTQSPSPGQRPAIQAMPTEACPRLSGVEAVLQPCASSPSQVAMKTPLGCLSPADGALYGPEGCPLKRCRSSQGLLPLPELAPARQP